LADDAVKGRLRLGIARTGGIVAGGSGMIIRKGAPEWSEIALVPEIGADRIIVI
jgi:hypothetical protein